MVDAIEILPDRSNVHRPFTVKYCNMRSGLHGKFNYLISYSHNFNRANPFEISDAAEI